MQKLEHVNQKPASGSDDTLSDPVQVYLLMSSVQLQLQFPDFNLVFCENFFFAAVT
jgi:hypothetical protein